MNMMLPTFVVDHRVNVHAPRLVAVEVVAYLTTSHQYEYLRSANLFL